MFAVRNSAQWGRRPVLSLFGLFSPQPFLPHGVCFLWQPELMWLHVASDLLIALAYYSIPFALIYFAMKRRDIVFRSVFLLFGIFIMACGTTHIMSIWTLWNPDYGAEGLVKVVTSIASVGTAIILWRIMPEALALPSPAQLAVANDALVHENAEKRRVERALADLNRDLEARVQARTAELEAANTQLAAAVRDKEALLREVHHRVKNNLQIVSSLLGIQGRTIAPELAPHFRESMQRIRALARLHQQLYASSETATVEVTDYLRALCDDLRQVHGGSALDGIRCDVEGGTINLDLDIATPVVLVLNEVISNAFKHGFPQGGTGAVRIRLTPGKDELAIEVRDNGVGLPADFEIRRQSSMGTRLIDVLVRQLGAAATFSADRGTIFRLLVPIRRTAFAGA
jgi:two-component sensor histidine kinase